MTVITNLLKDGKADCDICTYIVIFKNRGRKMNSESEISDDFRTKLHCIMAFIGGYIGAYALLNRADVFGNAQTANLIHLAMSIVGTNFFDLFIRIIGVALYMAGVALVVIWPKITKISVHFLAVFVDAIALIMLGFLPKDMNIIVSLYPIFFAAAVQWTAFPGVYGYNCSTIFSTNNLKQFTMAGVEYLCSHEKKFGHKAKFYGSVLITYHLGVVCEFLVNNILGIKSSWIGLVAVAVAVVFVVIEQRLLSGITGSIFGEKKAA